MTTTKVDPKDVRLGDRILCSDNVARDVQVIDHLGGGRFRFMFTDDRWLEIKKGRKATVVEPRPL